MDACLDLTCFPGVECTDIPAPGVGANCGDCPPGLTGDGSTCDGTYIVVYTGISCVYYT